MVSLALPLLLAVAATVSSLQSSGPAISLPLPHVIADGNTEFHNNLPTIQKMLQSLDLTTIAFASKVKIGTAQKIKGIGYWNPQVHGDEETLRQKAKIGQQIQDDLKKMQAQKTKKIIKRDLGDKVVVFLVNDVVEK